MERATAAKAAEAAAKRGKNAGATLEIDDDGGD